MRETMTSRAGLTARQPSGQGTSNRVSRVAKRGETVIRYCRSAILALALLLVSLAPHRVLAQTDPTCTDATAADLLAAVNGDRDWDVISNYAEHKGFNPQTLYPPQNIKKCTGDVGNGTIGTLWLGHWANKYPNKAPAGFTYQRVHAPYTELVRHQGQRTTMVVNQVVIKRMKAYSTGDLRLVITYDFAHHRLSVDRFHGVSVPLNKTVLDKDVHSGVPRGTPCGSQAVSDSYVLQGGAPDGCDTGDAFEENQAPGHLSFCR